MRLERELTVRFNAGSRVDGYDIIDELGEGAYAETYLARDVDNGRLVVLKAPNPDLFADPAIFQRYRRERLKSPGRSTTPASSARSTARRTAATRTSCSSTSRARTCAAA